MRLREAWVVLLAVVCAIASVQARTQEARPGAAPVYASLVYPFLGADWGGEVFVGAALPFGMVRLGPDMESFDGRPSNSGYMSGGRIVGFSHLHLSGASGKYGNILLMPSTGKLDLKDLHSPRTEEENHPGYYAATLTRSGVRAELTATRRVGLHRYTYPASSDAHLAIDLAHCLNHGTDGEAQRFLGGEVTVVNARELRGFGRYAGGWNLGPEYRVYFSVMLDTNAANAETWSGDTLTPAQTAHIEGDHPLGAVFHFRTRPGQRVQAKVGISFVSDEQARRNIDSEAPGWNFDHARAAATEIWNQALSAIRIPGATADKRTQFYTALYHALLLPSDRTGENPAWQSTEPYYDDYYAIWDTFRTQSPLLTLIAPDRERDLVRSLIDIYRHTGWMPDARSGNANGRTQGGSNAGVMVADAFVKDLKGIDYETALAAMQKDATVEPPDALREGRGGIAEWNAKGYLSLAHERAGSRTVEYAYDDFAIAELACGLGRAEEAEQFAKHAHNWEKLWDKDLALEGFHGFLRPRNPDGSWAAPDRTRRGSWHDFFYEGDLWTYSLYAPHDVARLVELAGGRQMFIARLDNFFFREHFDASNEPGFLAPVLYAWAGRPDHTAEAVTEILDRFYTSRRTGLPGNDDAGAMSSWFVFQSLGFYPNAGQDFYLIGTPSFPFAEIDLGAGKTLRIVARNLDTEHLNRFVQSARLNGQPLDAAWFRHRDIAQGGTLELVMGSAPSKWGTQTPPPSLSTSSQPFCAAAPGTKPQPRTIP